MFDLFFELVPPEGHLENDLSRFLSSLPGRSAQSNPPHLFFVKVLKRNYFYLHGPSSPCYPVLTELLRVNCRLLSHSDARSVAPFFLEVFFFSFTRLCRRKDFSLS